MTIATGTDKQIKWATDIKSQMILDVENYLYRRIESLPAEKRAANEQQIQQIVEWLKAQTDAKWWIDNRSGSAHLGTIISQAIKALTANQED